MEPTRIKVSGLTRAADTDKLVGIWAATITLHNRSPRGVSLKAARDIRADIRGTTKLVGSFFDTPLDEVIEKSETIGLDMIELHGSEDQGYCDRVKQETGLELIKAQTIDEQKDIDRLLSYQVDYYLAKTADRPFDLHPLAGSEQPIIIAGQLNCHNVAAAIETARPFAVDTTRGVEKSIGLKSGYRIKEFVAAVSAS